MQSSEGTKTQAGSSVADRRASPRVTPVAVIAGTSETGEPVTLVNVSEGGFMIHGPSFYTIGHMHEFEFHNGGESPPLRVFGQVVHVVRVSAADGQSYVTGLEFCAWKIEDQRQAIEKLLASAKNE